MPGVTTTGGLEGGGFGELIVTFDGLALVWLGAHQKKYPSSRATTTTVKMIANGAQLESPGSCV
jgi:hypothetical protein